jgi:tetratricopeptide (TPR) repeat protein
VLALIEQRNFDALEKLFGGHQHAFEADAATSRKLENVFEALDKVPRSVQATLDEWCKTHPPSYAAHLARAQFFYHQGLDARGTKFINKTPEENIRSMRIFFEKAQADLERSLTLTPKPYLSHLTLMSVSRTGGSGRDAKAHYRAAVKLAPQSIELRLAQMSNLEPRWGGSYREMELAYQDYLKSAQLGDAWGELMTGKYLWSGWGVKQDRDEALVWLRKAAEKGHPDAKLSLKQALEQLAQK